MELAHTDTRRRLHDLARGHHSAIFGIGLLIAVLLLAGSAGAQEMRLPKDVDFGGSGLVQFKYTCAQDTCTVRCFMTGNMVLEVKEAKAAAFTSYRSHSRQNAPEKEISITSKTDEPHYINFAGDGGCVFSGMRQESTSGFVSRTSIGTPAR